ncbi:MULTISPECIES: MBL fold metallo-hydrolase [Paenibacillus]|uniref:MBL fold metallo-hydrolase n=1 Tax=Paenibacillus TaxID=44249 RepID=UPI0022B86537|nr:MBL fold metallo-hydrolase [Paenibacillus caseinilyticus]MCZ8521270.1 MBL fold metallo-hydrolase [Paenibacillus caseinilyticus]
MADEHFAVHRIDEGIYHLFEAAGVGCTLVTGTDQALLLDTGYGFGDLERTVRRLTDLPLLVVNSHGHIDHIGGNHAFGEAYLHEDDMDLARQHSSEALREGMLKAVDSGVLPDGFQGEAYIRRKLPSWTGIREGHVFRLGDRDLEVYHTPGHSPGSIALLDRKTGTLLGADTVMPMVWLFLPESTSVSVYQASLEKLRRLPFRRIVSSHFPHALDRSCLEGLIRCASRIDVSKSVPYSTPLAEGEALLYTEEGEAGEESRVSIAYHISKLAAAPQ